MKKLSAVAMTAAFVLTSVGSPAVAQEDKIFIGGLVWLDRNGDHKAGDEAVLAGEKVVKITKDGTGELVGEYTTDDKGMYVARDLPTGKYEFVAADYTGRGLTLVEPAGTNAIDWATGRLGFTLGEGEGAAPLIALYADAKADMALETAITPAKDVYTVGDQIDLKLTLSNKGNAPVAPTFVLGSFAAKLVSHSDNVTLQPGTDEDFSVKDKILPGKQVEVALKIELNDVTYTEVHAMVRFGFGRLPDVNHRNNVVMTPIKIVEKGTETTTPPSSSTQTAAPTTTTTDAAVAKAGNESGLASTGASPLGFLGLGALLLAAGTAAFFVARRRRS